MTREEQIINAATEARMASAETLTTRGTHHSIDDVPFVDKMITYDEVAENAFIKGAEWADNHLKYSWINSNDELPTKGGHYLCMDDNHNVTTLAFCGDKWINSRTFTDVPLEIVIYWMPIPKLPKE